MQFNKKEITQRKKDETETARIEAFSDGVFSIAITLLVLDLIGISHPQTRENAWFNHSLKTGKVFLLLHWGLLHCWYAGSIIITFSPTLKNLIPTSCG